MATKVIVLEGGMLITGTFFGSQAEYDELDFEGRLTGNATDVAIVVLDDWLGAVGDWFEKEALQLVGGIVRLLPFELTVAMLTFYIMIAGFLLLEELGLQSRYSDPSGGHREIVQLL